jgi:hypothetical protein
MVNTLSASAAACERAYLADRPGVSALSGHGVMSLAAGSNSAGSNSAWHAVANGLPIARQHGFGSVAGATARMTRNANVTKPAGPPRGVPR